jgi:dTDP-L-rhamnose 4-epimerase
VINIGSGRDVTILEVAQRLAGALGRSQIAPDVTQKHRVGDIRHCFADIERARQLLGYSPTITLEQGLASMTEWLSNSNPSDRTETARRELETRGLTL